MAIDNVSTAWAFGSYDGDRKRLIKISENAQLFAGTDFNGHPNGDFHRIHDDGVRESGSESTSAPAQAMHSNAAPPCERGRLHPNL
jgi:hypothetical protein